MRRLLLVLLAFVPLGLWAQTPTPPANDHFAKAQVLTGPTGTVNGTTVGATLEKKETIDAGQTVWYSFTAPSAGYLQISLNPTNSAANPMVVRVWRGSALSTLTQLAAGAGPTSSDAYNPTLYDTQTDFLVLPVPLTAGEKVFVQFDDILQFNSSNDDFEALPGTFSFTYQFATGGGFNFTDSLELDSEGFSHYTFRSGQDTSIVLTVGRFGSTQGSATVDYQLASTGFTFSEPATGTLTFGPGVTRQTITLAFPSGLQGNGTLSARLLNPSATAAILGNFPIVNVIGSNGDAPGDDFSDAVFLSGSSGSVPLPVGEDGPLWFEFIAPGDGILTVGGAVDPLAFYEGNPNIPTNQRNSHPQSDGSTVLTVQSGRTYYIAVPLADQQTSGPFTYQWQAASYFSIASIEPTAFSARASKVTSEPVNVIIARGGDLSVAGSVTLASSDGMGPGGVTDPNVDSEESSVAVTAVADTDFTPLYQEVDFAPGVDSVSVPVTIMRHTANEGDLAFNLHLSQPSGNSAAMNDAEPFNITQSGAPKQFFDEVAATFSGLLVAPVPGTGEGFLTLTIGRTGLATFSLRRDGATYTKKVQLPHLAELRDLLITPFGTTISRGKNLSALTVTLQLPVDTGDPTDKEYQLTGSVSDGVNVSTFELFRRSSFSALAPNHRAGLYTLTLTPDNQAPASVQLPGYASLKVSASNSFTLTGALPDGTKFSGGGFLAFDGQVDSQALGDFGNTALFAIPLYSKKGLLSGQLRLSYLGGTAPPAASGDGEGSLRWVHPMLTKGTVTTFFVSDLEPFVSHFKTIAKEGIFDNASPLPLALFGLGNPPSVAFTLSPANKVSITDVTKGFSLAFHPGTGLFSGTNHLPGQPIVSFGGAVLQNLERGTGFAPGSTITVGPPPP